MTAEHINYELEGNYSDLSQETTEALLSELDESHLRQLLSALNAFRSFDEDAYLDESNVDLFLEEDDTGLLDEDFIPEDVPDIHESSETLTAQILELMQDGNLGSDVQSLLRGIVEVAVLNQRRVNTREIPKVTPLSEKQKEKLQQLGSDQVDIIGGLENPRIIENMKVAVSTIRKRIEDIFDPSRMSSEHNGKDPIFVVGGKSRAFTEFLLSLAIDELPEDHQARTAFKDRVRLSDTINKRLYDNFTSRQNLGLPLRTMDTSEDQQEGSDDPLVPFLDVHEFLSSVQGDYVIMVEDFMETGMKVERTLSRFKKSGIMGEYLIFFGPSLTDSEIEVVIEQNFILNKHPGLITVGGRETRSWELVKMLSEYLSAYVDLGRNQILAQQAYSFRDLGQETRHRLRPHEIARLLREAFDSE